MPRIGVSVADDGTAKVLPGKPLAVMYGAHDGHRFDIDALTGACAGACSRELLDGYGRAGIVALCVAQAWSCLAIHGRYLRCIVFNVRIYANLFGISAS
jgi:hypothetical protein